MLRSLCVVLALVSTVALMVGTFQQPAAALVIKCLYGELAYGQSTTISADLYGHATDTYVYDVFASSNYAPAAGVLIQLEDIDNVLPAPASVATPSSYVLVSEGSGLDGDAHVHSAYRRVGLDVELDTATDDGFCDVLIKASETGGLVNADANTPTITVDTYYD